MEDVYFQQIDAENVILRRRYSSMVNRSSVIFQQDSSRAHSAKQPTLKKKDGRMGILPHLSYSPDLAPKDFCLFRS